MNPDSTRQRQSSWLNLLVQQRGQFILAIPVSCLLASLFVFGGLQFNRSKAEYWVQHTQEVRLEAKSLLADLLDAETGVRGYANTSRQEFLEPYQSAKTAIPKSLNQLNRLVADNPSQIQRIERIRALAQYKLTMLERLLQVANTQPEKVNQSRQFAAEVIEGKQTMDEIRTQIDWFLAEEEILLEQRNQTLKQQRLLTWMLLGLSAGIGISGSLFAAYLLNRVGQKLTDRDRNLRESEARYRLLIENFPNGAVLLFNSELRYFIADGATIRTSGLSREQLEGKTIWESFPPETLKVIEPIYRSAIAGSATSVEILQADRIYLMNAFPVRNESGDIFAGMVVTQDITERKQSEEKLNQLNRALRTLSECNQVLVRATEESALVHDICRIIVEYGGYHSVWIGFAEQDEAKTVRPVAQFGFQEGYLESLQIAWSDTEQGRGPVGTVIRTGQSYISQNILTDKIYAPWLDAGTQRGYASSISLPLIVDDKPLGALNIYSVQAHAFNEDEVRLLTELANDLAYGITALRTQIERQRVEESLRDSEAKSRAFLESASQAILVSNANGEIAIFNAKAEELFGYNLVEVLGQTIELLMPERDHRLHLEYQAVSQDNPSKRSLSQTTELFARRKDGTEFPIEVGLSSISTKDGIFMMTFITDITERKQAEEEIKRLNKSLERRALESETRYQQIVELAEEGIWVVDSESKTTYVNQAMARMLNYTEVEMLGRPIFDFINETDYHTAHSHIDRRKQGKSEKHEFKLKTKDGKSIWTYMSTSPVLDETGKMLWSCTLVYDITKRKQAEEQVRQSSERISLANAELARATRLKDEFLASMSHELRTPLNAILGLSEALQEEVYGSLTDKQRKSLITIEQSGRHLLELINDILDLSKIESGKMDLQMLPVSIEDLCQASLTFVRQQAHYKNIKLNFKIADNLTLAAPDSAAIATQGSPERTFGRNTSGVGEILVDERRMRQVLINLLSNAVKFTPECGEIWLQVEADTEDEVLHFNVIDTGIGIAPENIDKLFKPFVQLDSSLSRHYAGTGLGLALVRRIVELHGGSVSLESELGKGSRFIVTLPWKESQQIEDSSLDREQALAPLLDIHQAMIVEDSETAAKQVARYLAEQGIATYIHPCGEGTVQAALRFKPDVIILDLLLPNVPGWEVLQELKANPATQHIPVLVVSVVDERSNALALGASEYLLKPFNRHELHLALSKIFSNAPQPTTQSALVVMPQTEQQPPLILLAEDNEANIATLADYLQLHKFRVSLARNGLEAVETAKQQKPDLILMDVQMPEMDGLEAIRLIRSEADLANIPIIALTALAMPGDRERCLDAGAKEYLTKPVSLKKLTNIITQYINPVASG